MKTTVYNLAAKKIKEIDIPNVFSNEIRPDIIKRAVLNLQVNRRQKYGTNPRAGMEYSAKLSRRRRKYRGSYGKGISRVPRKVMLRRGSQFILTGAEAPGTVGGRKAHSPKSEKEYSPKINKKENRKAINSAISASIDRECLEQKGYDVLDKMPTVIDGLENLSKSKEALILFNKLGLEKELERASKKKIRAGKGTSRGRKYRKSKGPLIVVSKKSNVMKACRNLAGFDVSTVKSLNAELLAPGALPGRIVIWSLNSIEELSKEK